MKIKIPEKIKECFSSYKNKFNPKSEDDWTVASETVFGELHWTKPDDVLWLYATANKEGYEGSQTQIGVKRDGSVMWGYFSHCSCYGYENYDGDIDTFDNKEETFKMYEMEGVEKEVLIILKERLKKIEKIGIKDG